MTIERKLLGTTPVSSGDSPEAVSFDGTNDYLSRSSDMTGNADGKTFTLSFWIYPSGAGVHRVISFGGNRLYFTVSANGEYGAGAQNSSGSNIFVMGAAYGYPYVAFNTWNHVLLSINLANSSERHLYINDGTIPPNFTTYTNQNIDFTNSEMGVGAYTLGSAAYKTKAGRLAHVFLDYTYRNLSTTSNRRLFIDADGKPSSTIPSNPILYLPMTDAATAGSNSGTGGDFTVNGVLATAERGPNQDNSSASDLNGQNDYLNKTGGLTNGVDSKQWTISANLRYTSADTSSSSNNKYILYLLDYNIALAYYADAAGSSASGNRIQLSMYGPSGDVIDTIRTSYGATGYDRNFSLQISGDQTNFNKLKIMLNGEALAVESIVAQYNRPVGFAGTGPSFIGSSSATANYFQGALGEIWVHNTYTDLSTDNPFWDSDTNRPNSVRKVIENTGITPLIALPMLGNDAGNNLGSGGDFTVNSGPFVGARGGSEFWSKSIDGGTGLGYLEKLSALTGASASNKFTFVCAFNIDTLNQNGVLINLRNTANTDRFMIHPTANATGGSLSISALLGNAWKLNATVNGAGLTNFVWHTLLISIDLSNVSNRHIYVDGVSQAANTTWNDYVDGNIAFDTNDNNYIGAEPSDPFKDYMSLTYLTTDYIDFSQEANRNKFVDQLGYPKNLTQQISDGDISNPLIYMKFEDTAALGTNSGTGGNFTVNGTVTAGPDFTK